MGYFQHRRRSAYADVDTSNTPWCSRETKHTVPSTRGTNNHASVYSQLPNLAERLNNICKSPAVLALVLVTAHDAMTCESAISNGPLVGPSGLLSRPLVRRAKNRKSQAKSRFPSCCPITRMFQFCFSYSNFFQNTYHVLEVMNNLVRMSHDPLPEQTAQRAF